MSSTVKKDIKKIIWNVFVIFIGVCLFWYSFHLYYSEGHNLTMLAVNMFCSWGLMVLGCILLIMNTIWLMRDLAEEKMEANLNPSPEEELLRRTYADGY